MDFSRLLIEHFEPFNRKQLARNELRALKAEGDFERFKLKFLSLLNIVDDITIPHMYVMTTNGSNSHMTYLDNGILKTLYTSSITRTSSPTSVSWRLGEDDTLGRFGNGNIYSCLRYNRVLSQSEIQQNYNATKGRFGL